MEWEPEPPPSTPDYMYGAWLDCLRWVISQPEAIARFRRDTGIKYAPPRNAIEAMVDEQSGLNLDLFNQRRISSHTAPWHPHQQKRYCSHRVRTGSTRLAASSNPTQPA